MCRDVVGLGVRSVSSNHTSKYGMIHTWTQGLIYAAKLKCIFVSSEQWKITDIHKLISWLLDPSNTLS